MSDKKQQPGNPRKEPVRKVPKAALVWLVILLGLGVLALFRGGNDSNFKNFNQTEFENSLKTGLIMTAEVSDESDRVFVISGDYRLTAEG